MKSFRIGPNPLAFVFQENFVLVAFIVEQTMQMEEFDLCHA